MNIVILFPIFVWVLDVTKPECLQFSSDSEMHDSYHNTTHVPHSYYHADAANNQYPSVAGASPVTAANSSTVTLMYCSLELALMTGSRLVQCLLCTSYVHSGYFEVHLMQVSISRSLQYSVPLQRYIYSVCFIYIIHKVGSFVKWPYSTTRQIL